jgi:hypothetical protein
MSSSQQSYTYDQLPEDNTFRYLILQPGAGYEPLVCNLYTAQIVDTEYHAMSYVWGTEIRDQTIICNGRVLLVTINLFKALQCIRLPGRRIVLWADSICINQEDKSEKGHQVSLMGKIYRSAKCVLIFIGSDDDGHGAHICSLLDEVDEMIQSTCKKIDMTWDSFPYPNEDDPLLKDPRWDSLKQLLRQSWFDRGWVVQEAALAARNEVLWGRSRFDWQKLMRTYLWLHRRGSKILYTKGFSGLSIDAHGAAYRRGHKTFTQAFYLEASWLTPSILETLEDARALTLGDPRDRIYAFTGLPGDNAFHNTIDPDYFASYLEVYRQFAVTYIQSTKNTDLLDFVCHSDDTFSDIPSWVPRWDVKTYSLAQRIVSSAAMQPRKPQTFDSTVINNGKLKVRGVIIDTVRYVSELFDSETTIEAIRHIWVCINAAPIKSPYTASGTSETHFLDAFLDALTAGTCEGEISQWLQARKSFAVQARLQQGPVYDDQLSDPSGAGADYHDDAGFFFTGVQDIAANCRFVLTERGYMGLCPSVVHEGDTCGIIFGCRTPYILRNTAQEQHYTFMGAATMVGKEYSEIEEGAVLFSDLGAEDSKDWVDWDVEEQDIYLC